MISQELTTYIKSTLEQGQTREAVKTALLSAGWTEADIEEGFRSIENEEIQSPPVSTQSNVEETKVKAPLLVTIISYLGLFSAIFFIGYGILGFITNQFLLATALVALGIFLYFVASGLKKLEKTALLLYGLCFLSQILSVSLKLMKSFDVANLVGGIISLSIGVYFLSIRNKFSGSYFGRKFIFGLAAFIAAVLLFIMYASSLK